MQSRSNTMTASMPFAKTNASEKSWRNIAILMVCGAILTSGFFFAARQHFSSMELGIQNSQLRNQLAELEVENRRLELAREVAMSPMAIRKVAHLIRAPRTAALEANAEVAVVKPQVTAPMVNAQPADTEVKPVVTSAQRPKPGAPEKVIIKTGLTKPAAKPQQAEKRVKASPDAKAARQKV